MPAVEDVPRLSVPMIREVGGWEEIRENRGGVLTVRAEGQPVEVEISLTADQTSLGTRWWFRCSCGSRRRYLHIQDGLLGCRSCLRLHYREQLWSDSIWRAEIGRPARRAWRACSAS